MYSDGDGLPGAAEEVHPSNVSEVGDEDRL